MSEEIFECFWLVFDRDTDQLTHVCFTSEEAEQILNEVGRDRIYIVEERVQVDG